MSEPLHEQLSAFIDGELARTEGDLFVRRLPRDSELRSAAGRYYLIGQAIRAEQSLVRRGFAARVAAAVKLEVPAGSAVGALSAVARALPGARWTGWWKPTAGVVVAAGVALVAILVFQNQQRDRELPQIAQATAVVTPGRAVPAAAVPSAASKTGGTGEPWSYVVPPAGADSETPLAAARLASYVFAHSEYSSLPGRRNVVSDAAAEESQAKTVPAGPSAP
jgi:negative regulator of sigma E activity